MIKLKFRFKIENVKKALRQRGTLTPLGCLKVLS